MKDKIEFKEFLDIESKLEITIGTITEVEDVPKSEKLVKLTVYFTEEDIRTVVTNIKPILASSGLDIKTDLKGYSFLFITNLNPVKMMGIESTAMILPGEIESGKLVRVTGTSGTKIL
jgi:tRNA-binding EMAP/Myf-like protein